MILRPRVFLIRRAFTLLELMVVIGIIGAMLALTIPAISGLSKANALNTGGRLVSNILTAARSEAINQRRLVQVRVATRWMTASGVEDTAASYRKFSVWRRPLPDDPLQPPAGSADPYIQVTKWETLPAGITFESAPGGYGFPATANDPKYPGIHFLDASLSNRKSNLQSGGSSVDVAWIEFRPDGSATSGGATPGRVYVLLTEGFWNGSSVTSTNNHANWLVTTVDTLVGRLNVLRP